MAVQGTQIIPTLAFNAVAGPGASSAMWNLMDTGGKPIKMGVFFAKIAAATNYSTGGGDFVDFTTWYQKLLYVDCQIAQTTPYTRAAIGVSSGSGLAYPIALAYGEDVATASLNAANSATVNIMILGHHHGTSNTYATTTYTVNEVGATNQVSATAFAAQVILARFFVVGF